jgi:hypothetical protein
MNPEEKETPADESCVQVEVPIAPEVSLPNGWDKLNMIERMIAECPQIDCPLEHVFTPGLYSRKILMPAGSLITSRIHRFEHPFAILKGRVAVWNDGNWDLFEAGYFGVTKPGSRRLLYTYEDTEWVTFHVTDKTDPDELVEILTSSPESLGHLEGLSPEKLAAVRNLCLTKKPLT